MTLKPSLLLALLAVTFFATARFPVANAFGWNPGPTKVPMGESLSPDPKLKFVDAAPAIGKALNVDSHFKFVDTNSNNNWDPGESVIYDLNNNGFYDPGEVLVAGTALVGSTLKSTSSSSCSPLCRFGLVDINLSAAWELGESVVYDVNGNGVYDAGEQIVAGAPPRAGASLTADSSSKLKFVDTTPNGRWDLGESMAYDSNSNGRYDNSTFDPLVKYIDSNGNNQRDTNEAVVYDTNNNNVYNTGEPVIFGTVTTTSLKTDSKLKIVDSNLDGHWEAGKAVVYDNNNNGAFDTGESIVANANPANQTGLNSDSKVKYVDSNGNNHWDASEVVAYDSNGDGRYSNSTDPLIKFVDSIVNGHWDPGESVVYDGNNNAIFDCTGEAVIAGPTPTCGLDSPPLSPDSHFRFVDTKRTGKWVAGYTVVYDSNLDNIYQSTEPVVVGTAPPIGTVLKEPVILGTLSATWPTLKIDPLVKFVDSSKNGFWDPGEAVVYDTNANNKYDLSEPVIVGMAPAVGTRLSEPVIAGPAPANLVVLAIDAKVKFIDLAMNGLWRPVEMVVYDNDTNGIYGSTDSVIAYGAQPNGAWDGVDRSGEVVVYDNNNSGIYTSTDPVILGSTPANGTALASDSRVKFVDANSNGHWDSGEMVAYDRNNNGVEDTGDAAITGQLSTSTHPLWPSAASDYLGRVWLVWNEGPAGSPNKDVYLKVWNGTGWTARQLVTSNPSPDFNNFITSLNNRTMMVVWSSNRTGHPQLFYRLYNASGNPTPTTGDIALTSSTMFDEAPSAVQDRFGRIWVSWARHNSTRTFFGIYYKYYNGTGWSSDFQLGPSIGTGLGAKSPSITETKDARIWIAWISNQTGSELLYYTSTDDTSQFLLTTGVPDASWVRCSSLPCLFPFESPTPAYDDDRPSLFQTSDGVFELFYDRSFPCGGGCTTPEQNVMYTNFTYTSNWIVNSAPTPSSFMNTITGPADYYPSAGQMSDSLCPGSNHGVCGRLWVFWNRLNTQTAAFDLIYANTGGIQVQHDVGIRSTISNITASLLVPYNSTVKIDVTLSNYGNNTETAQLTLKLNSTSFFSKTVTLVVNQTLVVTTANRTIMIMPAVWGRFTLTATLQCTCVESNSVMLGDNTLSGLVKADLPGDIIGDLSPLPDGRVDILDIADIAFGFGSSCGQARYHARDDINGDCRVDILDVAKAAFYFGKSV